MTAYSYVETTIIILIGVISAYHVIKLLMPRAVGRFRASMAVRLGRGAGTASRRHALAVKLGEDAPQSTACNAGCGSGCSSCGIAVQAREPIPVDEQTAH